MSTVQGASTTVSTGGTASSAAGGTGSSTASATTPTNATDASTSTSTSSSAANTTASTNTTVTSTSGGGASPTSSTNATSSSGGGAIATSSADTTGTGTTGPCNAPTATGTAPLIDDLDDSNAVILPNEGRNGYWYDFNDMSAGSQQVSAPILTRNGVGGVFRSVGTGFTDWGAAFGVTLNNDDPTSDPCPYNASAESGVQFNITSNVAVTFQITLPGTLSDEAHFQFVIPASMARGGVVQIPFSSLSKPQGATNTATWDPTQILAFQWQIAAGPSFDVAIDNLSFF